MYHPGTVLKLKEQRDPTPKLDPHTQEPRFEEILDRRSGERVLKKDPKTKEPIPIMLDFPYNEVRVVGRSPIVHSSRGDWQGTDAQGVIIEPISDFAANLDEPFGKLKQLYEVTFAPEPVKVPEKIEVEVYDATTAQAGETPEEVFAREAPGKAPAPGQVRGRTGPFDDVTPDKGTQGTSPL